MTTKHMKKQKITKSNAQKQKQYREATGVLLREMNQKLDSIIHYINGSKLSYETEIEVLREIINKGEKQ